MNSWWLALLAKPFIGIAWIAFLLVSTRLVATLIYVVMPDCRLKRLLFGGWDGYGSGRAASKYQRVLYKLPFIRGKFRKDRAGL
jgi:hypothetical protein